MRLTLGAWPGMTLAQARELAQDAKAARECDVIGVWKLEEKQSDVALALHAFSDAVRNEADQVIAVTNDSDFVPAMKMIREHTRLALLFRKTSIGRPDARTLLA